MKPPLLLGSSNHLKRLPPIGDALKELGGVGWFQEKMQGSQGNRRFTQLTELNPRYA